MAGENVLRLQILMKKVPDDYYSFFVTLPKIKCEQYLILLKGMKNLEMTYDVYRKGDITLQTLPILSTLN